MPTDLNRLKMPSTFCYAGEAIKVFVIDRWGYDDTW